MVAFHCGNGGGDLTAPVRGEAGAWQTVSSRGSYPQTEHPPSSLQALKSRASPCIVICYRHPGRLRMDAISMLWMLASAVIQKLVVSLYWPRTSGREVCLPATIQERCPSASSVAVSDAGILTFFYFDGQTRIRVRDLASPRASFPATWIHCSIFNARHFHGISRRAPQS